NVDGDRVADRCEPLDERVDVLDLVVGRHNHDQLCMIRCQTKSLPYVTDHGVGGSATRPVGNQSPQRRTSTRSSTSPIPQIAGILRLTSPDTDGYHTGGLQ